VLPVLIPDRVTLSSPTWSSSKLCVDGDDEVAAVAVSAGTEQSVDPLALEPEEHLAVQQPEPLLDRHVGKRGGELGLAERNVVTDDGRARDG
jgi:hypothetical protein